ncbi:hypothetical protein Tco_0979762 [Tanacetum coccineum]
MFCWTAVLTILHLLTRVKNIKGSNKTVESASVVLGKRKRTDEGDGAAASIIIPPQLHLMPFTINLRNSALEKLPSPTHESGAAASKIIPPQLHLVIKDALELRQHMMLNKINREVNKALKGENYSDSELVSEDKIDSELEAELRETEHLIRFYFESSKELKQLPHDWECDPETASTFVSAEADILTFRTTTRKERRMYFH